MSAMSGDAGIEAPISPVLETVQLLKILPLSATFGVALAKSEDQEQGLVGDGRVAPAMWSNWDDLCEQHKMTLKRFRVSDLVRIIKSTEVVLDNCKAFQSSGLPTQSAPQSCCTTAKLVWFPRCVRNVMGLATSSRQSSTR